MTTMTMMTRTRPPVSGRRYGMLSLVLGLAAMGCEVTEEGPRDIELDDAEPELRRALCERVFSSACRCDQWRWYSDRQECEADISSAMAELRQALDGRAGLQLTYDPACMGEYVGLLDAVGCAAEYDGQSECQPPCLIAHGSRAEGEECEVWGGFMSDCQQGLLCQGRCTNPCGGVDPDLFAQAGESCEARNCGAGLQCNFDTFVCERIPGLGEPCPLGECEAGAFCEAVVLGDPMSESRCFAPRELEQPCRGHRQCTSGYCPAGFCAVAPREGEACFGVCRDGLDCVEGMCVPGDSLLCTVEVAGS